MPEIKRQRPVKVVNSVVKQPRVFHSCWEQWGLADYRCLTVMQTEGCGWRASSQGTSSATARWHEGERSAQKSRDQIQLQLSCIFLPFGSLCFLCHKQDGHACAKWGSLHFCILFSSAQVRLNVTIRTLKSKENLFDLQCWTSHCGSSQMFSNRCSWYNFHQPKIADLHYRNEGNKQLIKLQSQKYTAATTLTTKAGEF